MTSTKKTQETYHQSRKRALGIDRCHDPPIQITSREIQSSCHDHAVTLTLGKLSIHAIYVIDE